MAHNDNDSSASPGNEALTPLPASRRVFGWHDHAEAEP